jgi:hypothetical protein
MTVGQRGTKASRRPNWNSMTPRTKFEILDNDELAALDVNNIVGGKRPHLVIVTAPPGIGSHLCHLLRRGSYKRLVQRHHHPLRGKMRFRHLVWRTSGDKRLVRRKMHFCHSV